MSNTKIPGMNFTFSSRTGTIYTGQLPPTGPPLSHPHPCSRFLLSNKF